MMNAKISTVTSSVCWTWRLHSNEELPFTVKYHRTMPNVLCSDSVTKTELRYFLVVLFHTLISLFSGTNIAVLCICLRDFLMWQVAGERRQWRRKKQMRSIMSPRHCDPLWLVQLGDCEKPLTRLQYFPNWRSRYDIWL